MIYFDSAATTLQKPQSVHRAVSHAMRHMASPGRGGHPASMLAADTVFRCRVALAEFFDVTDPAHIVFTHNATHALNIAIKALVNKGDEVVVSGYEHNSVMRPLHAIGADVKIATAPLWAPARQVEAFAAHLTERTKLVVCNHVSNVFGYILPIDEITALCREKGIPFVIDASQSAGVLPISMERLGADFIAMPGHKALYGPQGTGVLLCKKRPEKTLLEGGTGGNSLSLEMPDFLPDALEAGTMHVAGIAGLLAGVKFVKSRKNMFLHEQKLLQTLKRQLGNIAGMKLFAAENKFLQTGVFSFQKEGVDGEDLAQTLGEQGFAVRAGLHCSPLAHQSAGTIENGTVRVSFSAFNTEKEVEKFAYFLKNGRK